MSISTASTSVMSIVHEHLHCEHLGNKHRLWEPWLWAPVARVSAMNISAISIKPSCNRPSLLVTRIWWGQKLSWLWKSKPTPDETRAKEDNPEGMPKWESKSRMSLWVQSWMKAKVETGLPKLTFRWPSFQGARASEAKFREDLCPNNKSYHRKIARW